MAPKRKLQEEGEPPKKKAPTFTEQEARKLIALYCEARERYHGKFKSGSRSGPSERQTLLKEWSNVLSSMGVAKRTPEAIEEKLKNEVKRVQKHLRTEKEKHRGTGGGEGPQVPKLPSYLDPLVDVLAEKHLEHGVPGIEDTPPERGLDLSEESPEYAPVFELERKPTKSELRALLTPSTRRGVEQPVTESQDTPSTSRVHQKEQLRSEDDGSTIEALHTPSPEVEVVKERRGAAKERTKSAAQSARESLSLFTDRRSLLWEAETNLAKANQEVAAANKELADMNQDLTRAKRQETAVRHEEAKVLLELRKVELARAKLELERLTAAVPGGTASTSTAPPTYPYTYYNM